MNVIPNVDALNGAPAGAKWVIDRAKASAAPVLAFGLDEYCLDHDSLERSRRRLMKTNSELVTAFFQEHPERTAAAMCGDRAPNLAFSGLALSVLSAEDIRKMWHWYRTGTEMRPEPIAAPEFRVTGAAADGIEACYRVQYTVRGNRVDYWIEEHFAIRDGLIAAHVDKLSIAKWRFAHVATGFAEFLAAYTNKFDDALQAGMQEGLRTFMPGIAVATQGSH